MAFRLAAGQITENLHFWSLLNGLNDNCDILLVSRFEFTQIVIGVRAGGAGGAAAPPVSKIFGQNAKNSGNKETINDGIEK